MPTGMQASRKPPSMPRRPLSNWMVGINDPMLRATALSHLADVYAARLGEVIDTLCHEERQDPAGGDL